MGEKHHAAIVKYIRSMRGCAKRFGFRTQVLVDGLEEMMNNGWRDRIKKEKARKLKDIHREHEEKNRAQNHRHQHNNYNHQRNGGGGNGRNNRSSYDNNNYNGYGGRNNSQFKRGSSSNFQR